MKIETKSQKGRLLITGTILLVLLGTGVLITGRIINRTASAMNDRIISQMGEYHYRLLEQEFGKASQTLAAACNFVEKHPAPTPNDLEVLSTTLIELDPKISRIWFLDSRGKFRSFRPQGGKRTPASRLPDNPGPPEEITRTAPPDSMWCRIATQDGIPTWSLGRRITGPDGNSILCGIDYSLPELHDFIAEQSPTTRSYATVFTPYETVVYHPDRRFIGKSVAGAPWAKAIRRVQDTGEEIKSTSASEYLGIDVERIYYPLDIGGMRWVVSVNIPRLAIEQEMQDFHIYTIMTAIISVVLFAALLFVAQYRWRREYLLRQRAEGESRQLHLQQVIDQINPHFLFNSLNSLYVLINCKPELAREFTLTLSRVYRHVLEHRKEILATVAGEIDFTRQYYFLQKIRFEDRIELTTDIDPAAELLRIPSMSLQTLVENAVKHNTVTSDNPLRIRIYTAGERLIIENNYTPKEENASDSMGVGLERIRSIYRFYTAENIEVSIEEGFFRCMLPLLPAEK